MKTNKTFGKIGALNKQTVSILNEKQMGEVNGGTWSVGVVLWFSSDDCRQAIKDLISGANGVNDFAQR